MSYDYSNQKKVVLATIEKNRRGDAVQISSIHDSIRNSTYIDIRNMFIPSDSDDDELRPTAKGIRVKKELLNDIIVGLVMALDKEDRDKLIKEISGGCKE